MTKLESPYETTLYFELRFHLDDAIRVFASLIHNRVLRCCFLQHEKSNAFYGSKEFSTLKIE